MTDGGSLGARRSRLPAWALAVVVGVVLCVVAGVGLGVWAVISGAVDPVIRQAGSLAHCVTDRKARTDALHDDGLLTDLPSGARGLGRPWSYCDAEGSHVGLTFQLAGGPDVAVKHYRAVAPRHDWSFGYEWDADPGFGVLCLQRTLDDCSPAHAMLYLNEVGEGTSSFTLQLTADDPHLDSCNYVGDASS